MEFKKKGPTNMGGGVNVAKRSGFNTSRISLSGSSRGLQEDLAGRDWRRWIRRSWRRRIGGGGAGAVVKNCFYIKFWLI